jgi:hypothetical protein
MSFTRQTKISENMEFKKGGAGACNHWPPVTRPLVMTVILYHYHSKQLLVHVLLNIT